MAIRIDNGIPKQEINPFVGPRPFRRDAQDQVLFFGRDHETDEIVSLILRHKLTLVYAQSGCGKTSIFNAQIAPTLEQLGCETLPLGRTFSHIDPLPKANFYLYNLFQSLCTRSNPQSLVEIKSLSEFLNEYFPNRKDKRGKAIPQVLIIDQLEELFTLYTDAWSQQQDDFFQEVADVLNSKDNYFLRIVLIMREDYLAFLDPFLDILPERLAARFRLERLKKDAALLAIKGPLEKMIVFDKNIENEMEAIVDNLLRIRIEIPKDGRYQEERAVFVEPIQLQVVCQRWWNERSSQNTMNSKTLDVDMALQDFYSDSIHEASNRTGIHEQDIREWCEQRLITSSGTRSTLHKGSESTAGMSNEVLEILEERHLIRAEWRAGGPWYELTHDRLINPIVTSNKIYRTSKKKYGKTSTFRNIFRKIE